MMFGFSGFVVLVVLIILIVAILYYIVRSNRVYNRNPYAFNYEYLTPCEFGFGRCAFSRECVSFSNDPHHCSGCGNECESGTCIDGACVPVPTPEPETEPPAPTPCPNGETLCNDACANLNTDVQNCGGCGASCGINAVCTDGVCVQIPI